MATFAELSKNQQTVGDELQKAYTNYKKEPKDRKSLDKLQSRLETISKVWEQFHSRHLQLMDTIEGNEDHPYLVNDYFNKIKSIFEDYIKRLQDDIKGIQCTQGGPSQIDPKENQETRSEGFTFQVKDSELSKRICLQEATISDLERLLASIDFEKNIQHSRAYYQHKMRTINEYWTNIASLHRQLLVEASEAAYNRNLIRKAEDQYHNVAIFLQEKIDEYGNTLVTPTNNVKLPKITLPIFDGNQIRWTQFMDLFTQLIHNQPLGSAEKMYYLKANLTGEPNRLIRHLQATEENYATAWQILVDRYDNQRKIITTLLNELLTQPNLTVESSNGIRKLHDTSKECLLALSNISINTDTWGPFLLHLLLQKLDKESRRLYEQSLQNPRDIPTMSEFFKFLESRFQMLEAVHFKEDRKKSTIFTASAQSLQCPICKADHPIYNCKKFLQMSTEGRNQTIKQQLLCRNCLKASHSTKDCHSRGCTKCNGRHNTLIHDDSIQKQYTRNISPHRRAKGANQSSTQTTHGTPYTPQSSSNQNQLNASLNASSRSCVLLATAVVNVVNSSGTLIPCRVLLDSGSQLHFVCERIVQTLGLKRSKVSLPFSGIGGIETTAKHEIRLIIKSRTTNFSTNVTAIILPRISLCQPSGYIDVESRNIPSNIQLADPAFFKLQEVDMLIGAELYFQLLQSGQIRIAEGSLILQNSYLGWIIAGRVPEVTNYAYNCNIATQPSLTALEKQVKQFWEMEQHGSPSKRMTKEEHECEQHFQENFQHSSEGKFIVRLPFREQPSLLGASLDMAIKRFLTLERKLVRNPALKKEYSEFIHEYESLGHMQSISKNDIPATHYYLPHHCVIKPESSPTKLRVVFDASAKTTSGTSLNDLLMVGPTVQSDLFSILLRFRMHRYVLTADINKMFRQIELDQRDRQFQLIIWRDNRADPLQFYQLNTVTYGMGSAPFLTTRCLKQLALEANDTTPQAANVLQNDTYVDDILTGSNSMQSILDLKTQLITLLKTGNFELRKFCSNHPNILRDIPEEHKERMFIIHENEVIKALGMIWQPHDDNFQYRATAEDTDKFSKRTILSDVARIFDPLGLIGPVTVLGKLFIQELWKEGLSWDDELPVSSREKWRNFKKNLSALNSLKIPRHIQFACAVDIQLNSFSDSSESAYGACCYVRSTNQIGQTRVRLLCAKSRLAPLQTVTLASLELRAAELMAELVDRVLQCLPTGISKVYYYTDSTTVLSWISSPSYTWSTYVANRVAKIQNLTQIEQWKHIEGSNNPADIISRGMLPDALAQSTLWFRGPSFLTSREEEWPKSTFEPSTKVPELRTRKSVLSAETVNENCSDLLTSINHQNSFTKLQRIIAYCIRFKQNCNVPNGIRTSGAPTVTELNIALNAILRQIQQSTFAKELRILQSNKELDDKSPLQALSVYIDEATNLIKVGGGLRHADLEEEAKNQILLPKNEFVEMLFAHLHQSHMHAGPQTLLAIVRQRFWVIDGRRIARKIVHDCIRCFRFKPITTNQIMGNLPEERIRPSHPFHTTGIDFCGPIYTYYKLRGSRSTKTYIAVFVCFSTKAVHLELVSDLSSLFFFNCLKRFISRRGLCAKIFCDNATNFVGARSELKELQELFNSQQVQSIISQLCAENHIEWKPIPPRSPHFGGLWEAAVKTAKTHLLRQVGNSHLTYEEMHTIITQIEAIMNSRPLTPMSSDPNDLEALTPGHFLVGSPLTSFAEPDVSEENIGRLSRFQRLQHIQQTFWKRWSLEYIQELQTKQKWKKPTPDIQRGTLVLIKEQNMPPLKWLMGRVLETHEGSDKRTRVATLKTANGELKRAVHNLCPLPIEESATSLHKVTENQTEVSSPLLSTKATDKPASLLSTQSIIKDPYSSQESCNNHVKPPFKFPKTKPSRHPNKGKFLPIRQWGRPSSLISQTHDIKTCHDSASNKCCCERGLWFVI